MNNKNNIDSLLSVNLAVQELSAALGGTADYWTRFLVNNRRPGRSVRFRILYEVLDGRPLYVEQSLRDFIDWEASRRRVRDDAIAGSSRTAGDEGEWLARATISVAAHPTTNEPVVTIRSKSDSAPLVMSVEAARSIALRLLSAAEEAEAARRAA